MLNLFKQSAKIILNCPLSRQPFLKKQFKLTNFSLRNFNTNKTQTQYPSQNILVHKVDQYRSATIDTSTLPDDPVKFDLMLKESLDYFREVAFYFYWVQKSHFSRK